MMKWIRMKTIKILLLVLFVGFAVLFSCKRGETQTVLSSDQPDYSITYKRDSIIVKTPGKSVLRFLLFKGEYYIVEHGYKSLFFSTKTDTTIVIPQKNDNTNNTFRLKGIDKMYIGHVEKSPLRHHQLGKTGYFVTEIFTEDEEVKCANMVLKTAYYYDINYKIIGIEEIGYQLNKDKEYE